MLFEEQIARKPDLYPWTAEFMDTMWESIWTPKQFSFVADQADFDHKMNTVSRGVIVRCICAIAQVEISVKTFWALLGDNLPHPSIKDLGYVMANSEVIHNKAYEKLLEKLGLEDEIQKNLATVPCLKARVQYLRKHLKKVYADKRQQYVYSIILFTLFVERTSLFSQFYTVLYFNRFRNVLRDTAQQVQYTRNEELMHAQIGIKLVNVLREEYPQLFDAELEAKIAEEINSAFEAESNLIDWMLGDFDEPGLNPRLLKNFIAEAINDSMKSIGFAAPFEVDEQLSQEAYWFNRSAPR